MAGKEGGALHWRLESGEGLALNCWRGLLVFRGARGGFGCRIGRNGGHGRPLRPILRSLRVRCRSSLRPTNEKRHWRALTGGCCFAGFRGRGALRGAGRRLPWEFASDAILPRPWVEFRALERTSENAGRPGGALRGRPRRLRECPRPV